jgi:hypothetical protein
VACKPRGHAWMMLGDRGPRQLAELALAEDRVQVQPQP